MNLKSYVIIHHHGQTRSDAPHSNDQYLNNPFLTSVHCALGLIRRKILQLKSPYSNIYSKSTESQINDLKSISSL